MGISITSADVSNIISILSELIPLVDKEVIDIWPRISAVVSALMSNDAVTQDQLDQLSAIKDAADEAFDAAVAARSGT